MRKFQKTKITLSILLVTTSLLANTSVKKETNDKLTQKTKEKIYTKWTNNPMVCFSDVAGVAFPHCMSKKNNISVCQRKTIEKIDKICKAPLMDSIINDYTKETGEEIGDKKISKKFKKYFKKKFEDYKKEMFFFVGYKAGYYLATEDFKKIKNKIKELKEKKKNEKNK